MVIMRNPYSGGVVTVSISAVGRLVQAGWMVEEPSTPAPVTPRGEPAEPEEAAHEEPVEEPEPVGEQPKGNATRAAWREYAESLGIDVEGLTRAQIRDAVKEHQNG